MLSTHTSARVALLGAIAIATAQPTAAQPREQRLTQPNATFPEAFSFVGGVRHLPDGRVLIADPLGQALVVADLDAGTADTIGRVGQGPAEYRQPDDVFPLPGDSTLLVDLGNGRLTVLGSSLAFGPTTPISRPGHGQGPGPGSMLFVLPRGVDAQGRVYFQSRGGVSPSGAFPDSAPIMRWDRTTDAVDSVGTVKLASVSVSSSGGANDRQVNARPVPLSPQDAWAVAPDGRVAVARSNPYRLDWIHPDGRIVRGPAVQYRPVPIRRADKEEWAESLSNGLAIRVSVENGRMQTNFSRGGAATSDGPDLDGYDWPDHKPPFRAENIWVTPSGDAWVERSMPAGHPPAFDVFGMNGAIKGRVLLPAGRQIVGFGDGVVYAVRNDEYDLQWLERYELQ
jgi:hypothetical protein